MKLPIYLDYASTTPVDPRVVAKMQECLSLEGNYGNPASRSHEFGWKAEEAVEEARANVASLVNCDHREIVWTSGATESDNLAIKGAARFYRKKGNHIITSKVEHKAVLDSCRQLEREGFEVTYLDPDATGIIKSEELIKNIKDETILVSLMHVNNEIGVINDIAELGEITRENGLVFHVDAAQSTGKVPIDLANLKVDLMSFSAHKTYGFYYPEAGFMIFSGAELSASIPGQSASLATTSSFGASLTAGSHLTGSGFGPNLDNKGNSQNALRLVTCMRNVGTDEQRFRSAQIQNKKSYFLNVPPQACNFSTNPTFVSGSNSKLRHKSMYGNPNVFITTVGLHRADGRLVAVAKLSTPVIKNFGVQTTIKVNLTY